MDAGNIRTSIGRTDSFKPPDTQYLSKKSRFLQRHFLQKDVQRANPTSLRAPRDREALISSKKGQPASTPTFKSQKVTPHPSEKNQSEPATKSIKSGQKDIKSSPTSPKEIIGDDLASSKSKNEGLDALPPPKDQMGRSLLKTDEKSSREIVQNHLPYANCLNLKKIPSYENALHTGMNYQLTSSEEKAMTTFCKAMKELRLKRWVESFVIEKQAPCFILMKLKSRIKKNLCFVLLAWVG